MSAGPHASSSKKRQGPPRRPRGLSFVSLSPSQSELEERIRTVCLCVCASGVVAYGLARLKFALVPLVLSLSLKYLLQPLIDALTRKDALRAAASSRNSAVVSGATTTTTKTVRQAHEDQRSSSSKCSSLWSFCGSTRLSSLSRCWAYFFGKRTRATSETGKDHPERVSRGVVLALPHGVAVLAALLVALAFLATLAAVVAESVRDFTSRADAYAGQVQLFIVRALRWLDATGFDERWRKPQTLEKLADKLDLSSWVTSTVLSLGEGLLSLLSTTMLVLLFTLYLLLAPDLGDYLGPSSAGDDDDDPFFYASGGTGGDPEAGLLDDDDDDDDVMTSQHPEENDDDEEDLRRDSYEGDEKTRLRGDDDDDAENEDDDDDPRRPLTKTRRRTWAVATNERRRHATTTTTQRGHRPNPVPSSRQSRPQRSSSSQRTSFSRRVDRQINSYIKGKLALSLLVGLLTAALLAALSVDLWLAFAVVAFFANFVPNLGALVAIALPMPVVLIDPRSSHFTAFVALASLIFMHALVGNVVEPILFGHSMKLHPVTVLISLMVWSFLWGIPGLVLAVPLTSVCRIYLASIDHPLCAVLARALDGRFGSA